MWIYIISVSCQVAGAIMLLVKYWFGTTKHYLEEIRKKRTRFEDTTLIMGPNVPSDSEVVQEVWLSRFAFFLLIIGYFLGIFGNPIGSNRLVVLIGVIVLSCILVITFWIITDKIIRRFSDK